MEARPPVILALALLGAVLSSVIVSLALAPEPVSVAAEPDASRALLARDLQLLSAQLQQVDQRLRDLELRPVQPRDAAPRALGSPDDPSLDELGQRLAALEADLAGGLAVSEAGLLEDVGQAVELLRDQEQAARDAEREQRREERDAARLAELVEALGLNGWQQLEVTSLLEGARTSRDELRESLDLTGDRQAYRDAVSELDQALLAQAQQILSVEQLAQLDELGGLEAYSGGGGPGGRRGGAGGSGGPGGRRGR